METVTITCDCCGEIICQGDRSARVECGIDWNIDAFLSGRKLSSRRWVAHFCEKCFAYRESGSPYVSDEPALNTYDIDAKDYIINEVREKGRE